MPYINFEQPLPEKVSDAIEEHPFVHTEFVYEVSRSADSVFLLNCNDYQMARKFPDMVEEVFKSGGVAI